MQFQVSKHFAPIIFATSLLRPRKPTIGSPLIWSLAFPFPLRNQSPGYPPTYSDPMAHYDIFREELAQKFCAYKNALWEPSPGELYGPVAIGDVGYIRRGKFHRIFNALLPKDHRTHENFGTPENHEPLQLKMEDHIDTGILSPNDFCSAEVSVVTGGLNIFSSRLLSFALFALLAYVCSGQRVPRKLHLSVPKDEVHWFPFQSRPDARTLSLKDNIGKNLPD